MPSALKNYHCDNAPVNNGQDALLGNSSNMRRWLRSALIIPALLCCFGPASAEEAVDYGRDVRPILSENCFHCHGQDSSKRMAGLRLDSAEGATAERRGRTALVPGHPEQSAIYQRITAEQPARRMPPPSSNRTLTQQQIAILKRWIAQGGKYTQHWAFVPPARPILPQTSNDAWAKNAIDRFVLKRLDQEAIRPNAPASPAAWLRRVSLDLIGLPPTPADTGAFEADVKSRGETAYAAAVDRLLASPRYGERMAIDWLDVARYADTHGFNNDSTRSMWRWRDWVINAFNANMPYNEFLTEQLAGDLLPNPTLDQRIATGFGRNHVINSEGGIIEEEYRVEYVADRVRTLGMSWLGLTLECSRCHDHKFDPLTQRDYYRFFAFFNNIPEYGEDGRVTNAVPLIHAPTVEQQARMNDLEARAAKLSASIDRRERSWRWDPKQAAVVGRIAEQAAVPSGAVLSMKCEGIAGHACEPGKGEPQTLAQEVPISRRNPITFSLWVRPSTADTDVALLSASDYSGSTASVKYGKGIELRLVSGELEFRFGERHPAYSIRVRSEGAALQPDQWRHLTLVYAGAGNLNPGRADAAWVQIYVDGREVATTVLNEGVSLPDAGEGRPDKTQFRLGWDNASGSARYAGLLDEISIWPQALSADQISAVFEKDALPWGLSRLGQKSASTIEQQWVRSALLRAEKPSYARDLQQLNKTRAELLALRRNAPTVMVMEEMTKPRETHVLLRGAYNAPGDIVQPAVPEQLLGSWPEGAPHDRLGLAQWLTKPDHPLTARVVVNRFWQQLFGTGIVKTSENFGMQGEFPSHPELLDWLAREFIDSGWDVKALFRQIVLSATYRQDSTAPASVYAKDPENRLLARGPRFRLPAEIIRDQALFVSGLLNNRLGGPSVFPYQPADLYKGIVVAANYPGTKYVESTGPDLYRRSLYTFWKRTVPHPTMTVLDAPDREFCIVKRSMTNTPLQALTLLNDPTFVEAGRKLAERSFHEGGKTASERLAFMFRVGAGRAVTEDEAQILARTYGRMLSEFQSDAAGAAKYLTVGASPPDRSIAPAELAAQAAVATMILNMDEVITKS
jgi:hypothetical protein